MAVGSARADLSALQGLATPPRPGRDRRARWSAAPGDEHLAGAPGARPARRQHGADRRAPTRAQPAPRPPQRAHRYQRAHRRRGHMVTWSCRPRRPRCARADRSRCPLVTWATVTWSRARRHRFLRLHLTARCRPRCSPFRPRARAPYLMHLWTVGTQSDARGTRNRLPSRLPQAHQAFCQFCDVCPVRESRESGSCVKVREISGF